MLKVAFWLSPVVAIATHEACHAAACQYYGARWRPAWCWENWSPAIKTRLRDHTSRSFRVTCLAPLAMFVPALVAVAVAGPNTVFFTDEMLSGVLFMWCLGAVLSPADVRGAWHADWIDEFHNVWWGEHPHHAAAEGI